ncbi:MAG: pesticidal protein Cry7Aa [Bacteroidota bacterium]|nr:pesticidal protein Cry7Aa [Bacteroidota bacterium]
MLAVKKEGIILKKTDLVFEAEGVLNPAVYQDGEDIHMFYRAVRAGNYSTIGYCRLSDPLTVAERSDTPVLFPQFDYESQGVEDARIVKIDDLYYMTYTAYDGINALGALAVSKDLKHFEKRGIIVPQYHYEEFRHLIECKGQVNVKYFRTHKLDHLLKKIDVSTEHIKLFIWDKNVIFFPRRINGKLMFLHRIRPGIQLAAINDLEDLTKDYWDDYFLHFNDHILMDSKYDHEGSYIGGGCPPIETEHGWLLIYHGVRDTPQGYVYCACAALFDLENPMKEIARLPYALISPQFDWELFGEVNNVCFPTGTAVKDDILYIYYGAADERIACASVSLQELLIELLKETGTYAPA